MTTTRILSVWIGNLADYNAGLLNGQWFDLDDFDADTLQDAVDAMTNDGEDEFFIADFETPFNLKISEYESIDGLYEKYDLINDIMYQYGDNYEDIIEAYTTMISDDLSNIDQYEFIIYYGCDSMAEVAEQFLEETGGLAEIPEYLRNYFDFEAYGRDMEYEGCYCITKNGNCVEIIR